MSDTDLELLARYARQHAEDAFAELVQRHLGLVYSAAVRQVRSPQLAEEVAQSVFTDLARNASRLKPDTILTAWLYQVTRRTAIDVVRREASRQLREQIASEMNAMNATVADWTHIEPLLDEATHALDDTDRAAVLLRYFEDRSLREVGDALGSSENAAQKRLTRAVERLREFFAKRGISVGASGLVVFISANAVQAAPAGLAAAISTATALAGTTIAATATGTAAKAIAMTTLQKTVITATLAAAVGTGIYEARQASTLRAQLETLQEQQARQLSELGRLRTENQQLARLKRDTNELEQLRSEHTELLRLRRELGILRRQAQSTIQNSAAKSVDSTRSSTVRQLSLDGFLPRADWADAGVKTPEAALQTFFWALSTTNVNRAAAMIKWDMKDAKEVLPPLDPSTRAAQIDGIPSFMRDAVSNMAQSVGKLGALKLLSSETNAEGQAVLRFEAAADDGKTTTGGLRFFGSVGGQWVH